MAATESGDADDEEEPLLLLLFRGTRAVLDCPNARELLPRNMAEVEVVGAVTEADALLLIWVITTSIGSMEIPSVAVIGFTEVEVAEDVEEMEDEDKEGPSMAISLLWSCEGRCTGTVVPDFSRKMALAFSFDTLITH